MNVQIQMPEDFADRLQAHWKDLPRRMLEAVAIEAYRDKVFTAAEIGRLLGHTSRWQTEKFLHDKHIYLHYSEEQIAKDTQTIKELIEQ
jgi:predicted HTH domain antitoxin